MVRFSDEKSPRWFVLLRSEEAHWPKNVEENVQMISLPGFQRLFCQQLCNRHFVVQQRRVFFSSVNSCTTETFFRSTVVQQRHFSVNSCATKTLFCQQLCNRDTFLSTVVQQRDLSVNSCATKTLVSQQFCNRDCSVNSCATKTLVSQQLCNRDCSVNSCATKTLASQQLCNRDCSVNSCATDTC